MVVRLVRAGVGALLLLIAVPLALAGGGLLLAMEHRATDDTFTARLERVRVDGSAVVVSDVDALLRADAPFARGGQTTLSLSAVGSGGPLFIGLGPDTAVERYLDGRATSRLTRVRLARGSLPVELTTEPAHRSASQSGLPGTGTGTGTATGADIGTAAAGAAPAAPADGAAAAQNPPPADPAQPADPAPPADQAANQNPAGNQDAAGNQGAAASQGASADQGAAGDQGAASNQGST